jgi:hypothetical protein
VRRAGLSLVLCVFLACDGAREPPGAAGGSTSPRPTATQVQQRSAERPRPKLQNEALGPSRRRVRRAVRDLKKVRVWHRLTRGLYIVQLQTDPGAGGVPEDGHLADARRDAVIDEEGSGSLCSVRIYPGAIKRELETLRQGYDRGVFGPPPSLRVLWATVLAHELAHCRRWNAGEPYAAKWEERVRRRLERLRVE